MPAREDLTHKIRDEKRSSGLTWKEIAGAIGTGSMSMARLELSTSQILFFRSNAGSLFFPRSDWGKLIRDWPLSAPSLRSRRPLASRARWRSFSFRVRRSNSEPVRKCS